MIRVGFALSLGLALTLAPLVAHAQSPDEERAVALGHEALALFESGDCAGATARFEEADRLIHSPVFLLHVARCKRKGGQLVAARADYLRIAAEVLSPSAPDPWRKARADAVAELAALDAHIPSISIVVRAPRLDDVTVRIDGEIVAIESLGRPLRVDPGVHKVRADRPGEAPIEREIQLSEDRMEAIELSFGVPAVPAPIAPVAPIARKEGSLVPGLVVLGIAGVALGVGGVTEAIANLDKQAVVDRCNSAHQCLTSDIGERNAAITLSKVSVGAFIAGSAIAAAGVVVVIVRPGGSSAQLGLSPRALTFRVAF